MERISKGCISVEPQLSQNTLRIAISASLSRVIPQVLGKVRHLFDLSSSPWDIRKSLFPLLVVSFIKIIDHKRREHSAPSPSTTQMDWGFTLCLKQSLLARRGAGRAWRLRPHCFRSSTERWRSMSVRGLP